MSYPMNLRHIAVALVVCAAVLPFASAQKPQYPDYPSETPANFQPVTSSFDYERRTAEIPMRDGVKLHTVILVPKGAKRAPILFTRTPYSADGQTSYAASPHEESIL